MVLVPSPREHDAGSDGFPNVVVLCNRLTDSVSIPAASRVAPGRFWLRDPGGDSNGGAVGRPWAHFGFGRGELPRAPHSRNHSLQTGGVKCRSGSWPVPAGFTETERVGARVDL